MTVTTRLTAPDDPMYAAATVLFDQYRQHWGANPAPEVVSEWLLEQVLSSRARIYAAGEGIEACGICSVAVLPAALTLRTVWLVRDLFVAPEVRKRGVAHAILAHVTQEARNSGAHRLALQTDTGNVRAIELYAKLGFTVLTDVADMELVL